jgi:hypothetical protein
MNEVIANWRLPIANWSLEKRLLEIGNRQLEMESWITF